MAHFIRSRKKKAGQAPGTLIYVGEKQVERVTIRRISYNPSSHSDQTDMALDVALSARPPESVTWIDVEGLHDVTIIDKIGEKFGLHPLVREDILNTTKRPKFEDYD